MYIWQSCLDVCPVEDEELGGHDAAGEDGLVDCSAASFLLNYEQLFNFA